jgi:hypothetical protein
MSVNASPQSNKVASSYDVIVINHKQPKPPLAVAPPVIHFAAAAAVSVRPLNAELQKPKPLFDGVFNKIKAGMSEMLTKLKSASVKPPQKPASLNGVAHKPNKPAPKPPKRDLQQEDHELGVMDSAAAAAVPKAAKKPAAQDDKDLSNWAVGDRPADAGDFKEMK